MIMCKGECVNWSVTEVTRMPFKEHYRCRHCQIWLKQRDCWKKSSKLSTCPCCSGRVAIKPRLNARKRNYNEKLGLKRY